MILDEPTDGLDPNQKHEMRLLIRQIAAQKAIIISTHILEEVEAICTRAIIIARGRVVADKTPEQLMQPDGTMRQVQVVVAAVGLQIARDALEAAAPAHQVQVLEQRGAQARLMISSSDDAFVPEHVLQVLAGKQVSVLEISAYRSSLEDVFRTITRDQ